MIRNRRIPGPAAAAGLAFALSATAATYQWDGSDSTNWNTDANWTGTAPADANVTGANRLNVNSATTLVYSAAQGTSVFANTSDRGLVIGSGSLGSGTMEITGGSFSTLGSGAGDVISNQDNATGRLIINGGTFIGTNAGTGLGIGASNNRTAILDVLAGTATIATLNINTNTATINLSGGTLAVNNISRTTGTGTLNLNGGTLKARQNNTAFVSGLSAVNVNSGGAIIDTNSYNVTIGNILRDGGGGGGLTKLSAGTLTLTATAAFTGATTISGGTLQLGDGTNDGSIASSSAITNNAALAFNLVGSHTYGNAITGSGSLAKSGAGTLTLTNTNTYLGATSLTGGTLSLSGAGSINNSSGITVNGASAKLLAISSVAIAPTVTLTNGTLTGSGTVNTVNVGAGTGGILSNNNGVAGAALNLGTLTLAGVATINLYSNSTSAPLNVTTLTNNSSANAVTVNAYNAGGWTNGSTYTIIDYGTLGGSGGYNFNKVANNLSARQIGTWTDNGSAITLGITGDSIYWVGDGDGKWNTSSSSNWRLTSNNAYDQFITSDDVVFSGATGTIAVDINNANVSPNTITFNNAGDYVVGSTGGYGIASGTLTKTNSGALTLNTANSYTGGTTLNAGTINLGNAAALGASTSVFTVNGGTIDNTSGGPLTTGNHPLVLNGNFTFTGTNDLNLGTGAVSLGTAAGTTRTITTNAGTLTLGGIVSDGTTASNLAKSGNGTLVLSGASTFSGSTTVNGGILKLGVSIASTTVGPLGSSAGGTIIQGGGTLDFNGFKVHAEPITISGSGFGGNGALINTGGSQINAVETLSLAGNASIGGTGRWDLRQNTVAPTLNMNGHTLTKTGSNYVSLVGVTVSNPGHIDVAQGTFSIQTTTSMGGSASNTVTIRNGATLDFYQSGTWTPPEWTLVLENGANVAASNGTAVWNGPVTGAGGTLNKGGASTLTLAGGSANTFSGLTTVSAGTLNLNKTAGVNALPGDATVTGTGTLTNLADHQIADSATIAIDSTNASWNLGGKTETVQTLNLSGPYTTNKGFVTGVAGKLTVTNLNLAGAGITLNSAGAGLESSIEANTLTQTAGTWVFGTLSGTQVLRVGGGGLTIGGGSAINVATATTAPDNHISLGGDVTSQAASSSNSITTSGSATGRVLLNASRTFTVADGAAASDLTVSAILANGTGTGGLLKDGSGTMTLSAANTYSGPTTVAAGVLALSGPGSIANSSMIEVHLGAVLDTSAVTGGTTTIGGSASQILMGKGTINAGSGTLVLGNSATLAPGASPGTLTVNGSMVLSSATTLTWDLNGNDQTVGGNINDLVIVSGDLTLDGLFDGALLSNFSGVTSGSWRLFDYGGLLTDSGLVLQNMPALPGGSNFELDTATPGQVNLIVVPEPSAMLLALSAALFGLVPRRRR